MGVVIAWLDRWKFRSELASSGAVQARRNALRNKVPPAQETVPAGVHAIAVGRDFCAVRGRLRS